LQTHQAEQAMIAARYFRWFFKALPDNKAILEGADYTKLLRYDRRMPSNHRGS